MEIILSSTGPLTKTIDTKAKVIRTVSNHSKSELQVFYEVVDYFGDTKILLSKYYNFIAATGSSFENWRKMTDVERDTSIQNWVFSDYQNRSN